MTMPVIIAFAGALLSALAAILSSLNQAAESEENSKLSKMLAGKSDEIAKKSDQYAAKIDGYASKQAENDNEIKTLQEKLIEKAEIQNQKTEEINKLNLKLIEAQEKTIGFTSESLNYLTGGDSWCYLKFIPNGNELKVRLYHQGKYPLIALRVSIQHTSEMLRASKGIPSMQKGFIMAGTYLTEIPVGTVPKTHTRNYPGLLIGTVPYNPNVDESYRVFFFAQNGEWYQDQTYTYNDKRVITASTKVIRDGKELINF